MGASTVRQLAAPLDLEGSAGHPLTLTLTAPAGVTITSPVVKLFTPYGQQLTGSPPLPQVSQSGQVTTVAFSAAAMSKLNPGSQPGRAQVFEWLLEAQVDLDGPFPLVARKLIVHPPSSAFVPPTTVERDLAVTVGASIILDVTVSSSSGDIDEGSAVEVYADDETLDGGEITDSYDEPDIDGGLL